MKIFMRRDEAAANLPVASCKLPQPATFASQQKVKPAKRLSRRREWRKSQRGGGGGSDGRVGVGDKAMTSCRSALVASAAPLPLHVAATVAAHIYGKQIFISTAQAHPVHRVATVGGMWHAIIMQQRCKVCGAERGKQAEKEKGAKR